MSSSEASLDTLLLDHDSSIAALRKDLGDLPTYIDDIWLLRYVLSFDNLSERVEAIRKCIKWRS